MKTRAAVLHEYKKPLVIEELELEGPKEKEVLVQYKAAGLCHTDLSILHGTLTMPPLPCIPGHEGAGVVKEVGPGVTKVKPGDHVLAMWVPVCGRCVYCLKDQPYLCAEKDKARGGSMLDGTFRLKKGDRHIHSMMGVGTFSEYNVLSEQSILPIDKDLPFDLTSVVGCAVITGVGAVLNKAKVKPGSSVAVVGVGGIGLNVIQGAVLANATTIIAIDILDEKLELAKQFGATHTINALKQDPVEKALDITNRIGIDYSFEALGKTETAMTCFKMLRRGGNAVIVGVPGLDKTLTLPMYEFSLMEKSMLGSYYGSADSRSQLKVLLDLYKTGRLKLDQLVTKRYPFEQINEGFKDLESGKNARGVVVY
ncbi:MAG: Zn-dependent alcohol dehydrogenase [Desulfobacteraceae bacterium]|jgi:S-(hydroxymethyl)glutathione dehydrogenase/alcohol dehydrogenase|nr:MAG: Zn-dependent alcohol dehydrogenase [Desulfobacteraceae bacterium]